MNRERRDDGAKLLGQRRLEVIGLVEDEVGIVAQALTRKVQHRARKIDEMDARLREALADENSQETGAGAEIEDRTGARRDEVDRPAIKGVAARNEAGAVDVVGRCGGVEDILGLVGSHIETIR